MSYSANIERLRSAERRNVQQSTAQRTATAQREGQKRINEVNDVVDKLAPLSASLNKWRKQDIEHKKYKGQVAAREARVENAERLYELSEELKTVKENDTRYHEIKAEMLKRSGPSVYPDADRIAKLSHWEQVGYTQEKLRVFNDTYSDKLAHAMQNSEKAIEIEGITFTPKELHDNNISDPILKEAAIQIVGEDIKKAAELHRFSPEMLKLAGTSDAITKAKEAQLSKYRQRYNIESSANTRGKTTLEWQNSSKTGDDIYRYLLKTGATVDKGGNVLGNTGAWAQFEAQLVSEGIKSDDPTYAERLLDQPMPDQLALKLGAKKGTTFAQQWPSKANTLRTQIKAGIKKKIDDESAWLETAGTKLENDFIKAAREEPLSAQEVNKYKRQFGDLGLTIPSAVTNYETVSDRDEREDKDQIEALMASQNGYISHEQLDAFHPKAALEHREKATKLEEGALKKHDADKKIKAHLDTAFTNMGIKGNEKSPAYVEAMANAKADYAQKYNRYIAMGYNSAQASHLALHAQQVADKETGEVLPDSMGVLHEIKTNGESSKYVITGQAIEKELKPGHLRVARIRGAKQEILNDPNSVTTKVIGGDYGHRQITTIADNVEKHGRRGLYMDKGALQYYKGIARGRNARQGGWWGLVDAQLKAAGHKGLNPAERPKALELLTGEDANGNTIPDPRGSRAVDRRVSRAMSHPSQQTSLYAMNSLRDAQRFGRGTSVFDQPENLPAWYTLGGNL